MGKRATRSGGSRHELAPPPDLRAWEIEVGQDTFVLFEWDQPQCDAHASLTAAEREVLAMVARGLSNAEIAAERGTRPRTAVNQVASIFRKMRVSSRAELIRRLVHPGARGMRPG